MAKQTVAEQFIDVLVRAVRRSQEFFGAVPR